MTASVVQQSTRGAEGRRRPPGHSAVAGWWRGWQQPGDPAWQTTSATLIVQSRRVAGERGVRMYPPAPSTASPTASSHRQGLEQASITWRGGPGRSRDAAASPAQRERHRRVDDTRRAVIELLPGPSNCEFDFRFIRRTKRPRVCRIFGAGPHLRTVRCHAANYEKLPAK